MGTVEHLLAAWSGGFVVVHSGSLLRRESGFLFPSPGS